jgi:hypothetical protein
LVFPSFRVQHHFIIKANEIWKEVPESDRWKAQTRESAGIFLPNIEVNTLSIKSQIIESIGNARKIKSNRAILDGVKYYFYTKKKGELIGAFKHSPKANSKSRLLISSIEEPFQEKPAISKSEESQNSEKPKNSFWGKILSIFK